MELYLVVELLLLVVGGVVRVDQYLFGQIILKLLEQYNQLVGRLVLVLVAVAMVSQGQLI